MPNGEHEHEHQVTTPLERRQDQAKAATREDSRDKTLEQGLAEIRHTVRLVLWWMAIGWVLFIIAVGIGLSKTNALVMDNRTNIAHGVEIDKALAQEQYRANLLRYDACIDRNNLFKQQLRQDEVNLRKLIKAHVKDGSVNAARHWRSYLRQGQQAKLKLPSCGSRPTPVQTDP